MPETLPNKALQTATNPLRGLWAAGPMRQMSLVPCRLLVLLALAAAPASVAQPGVPSFVAKLIARYKSAPPGAMPDAVWSYRYKGATVYYVPRLPCCDIPSSLYDINGNLICHPDGGITGMGDGKCPDFIKQREHGSLLWKRSGA